MMFLSLFWKPIAALLLVGLVIGGIWYAKSSYDDGKRDEGRAEVRAELQPKLNAATERASAAEAANVRLAGNLRALESTLAEQAGAVAKLKADEQQAQAAARTALAKIAANSAAGKREIDRLQALARAVPTTVVKLDADSADADDVLRGVLRRRMAAKP